MPELMTFTSAAYKLLKETNQPCCQRTGSLAPSTVTVCVLGIPENILRKDPKPLEWCDRALTKTGE